MSSLNYIIHTSAEKTMTIVQTPSVPSMQAQQRSPWHSPVPYLFGGLAAMLGLIAFALLILACSYWRLSGYLDGRSNNERDIEAGESNGDGSDDGLKKPAAPVFEEKFLVMMPGQEKPTFIATPMSSRASSFGSTSNTSSCSSESTEKSEGDSEEKNINGAQVIEMGSMEMSHERADHEVP